MKNLNKMTKADLFKEVRILQEGIANQNRLARERTEETYVLQQDKKHLESIAKQEKASAKLVEGELCSKSNELHTCEEGLMELSRTIADQKQEMSKIREFANNASRDYDAEREKSNQHVERIEVMSVDFTELRDQAKKDRHNLQEERGLRQADKEALKAAGEAVDAIKEDWYASLRDNDVLTEEKTASGVEINRLTVDAKHRKELMDSQSGKILQLRIDIASAHGYINRVKDVDDADFRKIHGPEIE